MGRMSIGQKDMNKYIDWKEKKALTEKSDIYSKLFPSKTSVTKTKPLMAPVRQATYNRNPFKNKTPKKPSSSIIQHLLMSGSIGGLSGASGPMGWQQTYNGPIG